MNKFIDFLKNWGGVCLVGALCLVLLILFAVSQYTTNSAFMRIIYGILTLCPVGALLPWLTKRGLDNCKEGGTR